MKQTFENLIKTIPSNKQGYAFKQLQTISNRLTYLEAQNERFRALKTGVQPEQREDMLQQCIDILILHGYSHVNTVFFKEDFLNFMLNETIKLEIYKPKLITFEILNDLQQAYFMYKIEFNKEPSDYYTLRNFLINWGTMINAKSINQLTK